MRLKRTILSLVLGVFFSTYTLSAMSAPSSFSDRKIIIFAAASMKNALDGANALWKQQTGIEATVSYAASSTLAKQIENGAPADIFISADTDWMNYLAKSGNIKPQSIIQLLGNTLVLIKPKSINPPSTGVEPDRNIVAMLKSKRAILAALKDKHISMGAPDSVPAGKYAKAAFEKLGLWEAVSPHVIPVDNVRAALLLVARGEAALGVVYRTDARADKNVAIIERFPENSHPAIVYPAGIVSSSKRPAAEEYLEFLKSQDARPFFEAEGFKVLTSSVP